MSGHNGRSGLIWKKYSTIDIRKAKYTIGISFDDFWDDKKYSEKGTKYFDNEENEYFWSECFSKFIEINQNIKLGEKIIRKFNMKDKRYCTISLYKTIKPSPTFIFEEGVIFIGKCELDAGKEYDINNREIGITMEFGGTFIEVNAFHIKSGNKVKAKLIFN